MKKSIILGALAVAVSLTSCDDFLNDNRYPMDQQTNSPAYWNNSVNVDNQINRLYENFSGYGNGSGTGQFYFPDLSDDQAARDFANWTFVNVPASSGNWSSPYTQIRGCNLIIENVGKSTLNDNQKANYIGIARLMRAYQYYLLVRCYGDVPLTLEPLDPADTEEIYGPRVDRDKVMDQVLEDLNYACENIAAKSGKQVFSKDLAQAMKSEICLYEGTFCKYRTAADNGKAADAARAQKFLNEVVKAGDALIGSYALSPDYKAIYDSFMADMQKNSEMIFFKAYNKDVFMHSTIDYTCSSTQVSGLTKDAFDNFLFKDGKPLALTSMDKNDVGYMKGEGDNAYYYIGDVLATRDDRLSAMTDTVAYYQGMTWARAGAMEMTSSTGYGVRKFDNVTMPVGYRDQANKNYTCAPLYWISVIYCDYAEAKAELGTLNDGDLNNTLNKLYTRAGLPTQTVASLSSMNDPANNMGVSSLIWEVRRCRRCETMLDKNYRYWDLVRWHQLELLDSQKHPNILLGCNMTGASVDILNVNGYVDGSKGQARVYDSSKYYLYPIPSNQIRLYNGAGYTLTQNPGWN